MADFTNGDHKGKRAVAKRAKDGLKDPLDPIKFVKKERSKQMEEHDELAAAYLTTEGMNLPKSQKGLVQCVLMRMRVRWS